MSLCIVTAAKTVKLAIAAFTLSWTHSIERTPWEEDWRVTPDSLVAVEARITSIGAGMEMPEDALFDGHMWRWTPKLPPLPRLDLRRSEVIPEGWRLCFDNECRQIGGHEETADVVSLQPCA